MKILGITGGVGSGKSLVLSYLQEQEGIVVYEADAIARDLQERGSICLNEMVEYFGNQILTDAGDLNRKELGAIVFGDEVALEALNQMIHPRVRGMVESLIRDHKEMGTKVFVLEAALLLETNYKEICDEVWYIYTSAHIRENRLGESRNYSKETFANICASQMSDYDFESGSDRVIDNTKDISHLYENIEVELNRFLGEM